MTPNDTKRQKNHESVWELLPWYVNGTLNAQEAALVEGHLPHCFACQQEAKRCRNISAVTKSTTPGGEEAWTPSPRHFAQVLSQVEAADTGAISDRPSLLQKIRSWLLDTPSPMRWAFALQAALIVALTGALIHETATTPPQLYETLSRASQAESERARLRIVFAEEITEKELRDLLADLEGEVVHGPSPQGVYTIELSLLASEREAAKAISAKAADHPKIRFVTLAASGVSQ